MSKIVLTADWHWGVPGRLKDINWAARVVRDYCQQQSIDTIWVLGDLVHDRAAVELDVWNTLYDFLADAKAIGQNWYAFPGNHDMFLKHSWDITALRPLRDQINIIENVSRVDIDGRRFFVVPFIHLEKSYMRVIRKLEEQYQDGDVLLTHIGVRGSTLNTCFLLKDWSFVNFDDSKFRQVYTGHFHSRQTLNQQVHYPGSPIPFKFDEGDVPHGFYVLDLETMQHEFIDIWQCGAKLLPNETPPPQYYTILEEQLEDIEPEIIQNNMIRVAHQRDLGQDERDQTRDRLITMGGKAIRWLSLKQDTPNIQQTQEDVVTIGDSGELFEWWLQQDTEGTANLDKAVLRRLGAEIRHEGDERHVYAEVE